MKFIKAQTNGNDFVIFKNATKNINIKYIADRNFGIGADQIIFISNLQDNQYQLDFYNQDGSQAQMCGNGCCAAAFYINQSSQNQCSDLIFNIMDKKYKATSSLTEATIFLPIPIFIPNKTLASSDIDKMKFVCTGNKHIIYSVDDIKTIESSFAQNMQNSYNEYNIHYMQRISHDIIRIRSFEKGVGWTKSCGSGAIASIFSCCPDVSSQITVIHDGGKSLVVIDNDHYVLTTKPKLVFSGELIL